MMCDDDDDDDALSFSDEFIFFAQNKNPFYRSKHPQRQRK
jgi:hypothetical protein